MAEAEEKEAAAWGFPRPSYGSETQYDSGENSLMQTSEETADPPRQYRCAKCHRLLFEAKRVEGLRKPCERCKKLNKFDDD